MDLVHAVRSLILSRKDYSNSLLRKANVTDVRKTLQRVENRAACVALGRDIEGKNLHLPRLDSVQWVPVKKRSITFSLVVYKCLNNREPNYLSIL